MLEFQKHTLADLIFKLTDYSVTAIYGLLIIFVFWCFALFCKGLVMKISKKYSPDKAPIFSLLGSITKLTIFLLGIITALGSMGIDVRALVASLGLTGFAVSFALKDALSNVLSGFLILIYQPFRVGQFIEIGMDHGCVSAINLRYTVLQQAERVILVPNTLVFTTSVQVLNPTNAKME